MIVGTEADVAVDRAIAWVRHQRLNNPITHGRVMVAFPRVKVNRSDDWQDPGAKIAAAVAIMRDPSCRHDRVLEPKDIGVGHPIPSRIVYLNGVTDVEYKVSKHNLERLLKVGCLVIQVSKGRAFVRIPFDSPAYHGRPQQFDFSSSLEQT